MTWTRDKPTREGWYWETVPLEPRGSHGWSDPRMVRIEVDEGGVHEYAAGAHDGPRYELEPDAHWCGPVEAPRHDPSAVGPLEPPP